MAKTYQLKGSLSTDEVILAVEDEEPGYDELMSYLDLDETEMKEKDVNTYIGQQQAGFVNSYPGATAPATTTPTTAYHYCKVIHDGEEVIYSRGKRKLAGARGKELDPQFADLVIDLSGTFSFRVDDAKKAIEKASNFVMSGPEKFNALKEFVSPVADGIDILRVPSILRLDWQDMKTPPVGLKFWTTLWKLIPEGRTIFCCIGSHGRTGTALASMILAADPKISSGEAMTMVWDRHCEDAIETEGQMQYLRDLAASRPGGDGKDRAQGKKARK